MKMLWVLVALIGVSAAACSSGAEQPISTVPIDPESIVVTVEQTGGCVMMGPNCPTYVVRANGRVDLYRTGNLDTPVDSTIVGEALVTDLQGQISKTDFVALRARLPQGECQGCYDGIDTTFLFSTPSSVISFDSIETELVASEPLFAMVWNIVNVSDESTDMPLLDRSQ
jgi:hypothetical protein